MDMDAPEHEMVALTEQLSLLLKDREALRERTSKNNSAIVTATARLAELAGSCAIVPSPERSGPGPLLLSLVCSFLLS